MKKTVIIAGNGKFDGLITRSGKLLWVLLLLITILAVASCRKPERNNIWDEKSIRDPQEWAPQNLQIATLSPVARKLIWVYGTHLIEGFKIDRKKGEEPWQEAYAILPNTTREWIDDHIVPDPALVYQYRVYAYAGDNISTKAEMTESTAIPAPGSLQITSNSITSVTLGWEFNSTGIEGFRIERRYEGSNWADLAIVTTLIYQDSLFSLNTRVYYRISAYYGSYQSSYAENSFVSQIPEPEDFGITTHSTTSVTLNWNYSYSGHDGYVIDRKSGNEPWVTGFIVLSSEDLTYQDNTLDLEIQNYMYRICTYSGDYKSLQREASPPPKIGWLAHGGIVFYVDDNGHGLVCAESDQSEDAEWGCYGVTISGTGTGIGTGASNTAKIVTDCIEEGFASRICGDLVLMGYNDWFLPSKDELNLMYKNLKLAGLGSFSSMDYWTSTEFAGSGAWIQNFHSGYQQPGPKYAGNYVRAVRAF